MSAASRRKGARGEREAAEALRIVWPEADRAPMQARGATRDGSEISGTGEYWVEVKRGRATPQAALRQATRDAAPHGRVPIALTRADRGEWIVSMGLETFAALVPRPTRALSLEQVRDLLAEGREVRAELEGRLEAMSRIDPDDARRKAR